MSTHSAGEDRLSTLLSLRIVASATVDSDGYLKKPESWTREIGFLLARGVVPGVLTDDHWRVVDYLRQYYLRFGIVPPVGKLCRDTGLRWRNVRRLFPTGLARGACKVAGIPGATFETPVACLYP